MTRGRAGGAARRHPVLAAAVVYTLLGVVLLSPGLLPGHTLSASDFLWTAAPWNTSRPPGVPGFGSNPEITDPGLVFQPFLERTRDALPHVPLWDPYIMMGRPYVGNAQSAVFSPFSLPAYVLPFWWSLSLIALIKLVVAAMGTFLLARALGMRFAGALLAGVVYAFSLWFVVWLAWPLTAVWALIPWLLLATDRLVRAPGPLPAAGLAALIAAQFLCGHPESSVHALFVTVVFFALRLIGARRGDLGPNPSVRRGLAWFGGALVCGVMVAAAAIVPFAEALSQSSDVAFRRAAEATYTPRKYFFAILLYDYWGRPTQSPQESFEILRAFYVGALPLMLAIAALIRRRDFLRVAVAGFAVFLLLVILGVPPVFNAFTAIPGIHSLHNWRMTMLLVLCLGLLAGWGLDDLLERRPARRQTRLILTAGGALLLLPLAWVVFSGASSARFLDDALDVAWGFARQPAKGLPDSGPIIRLSALILWLTFAGAALGLLVARVRGSVGATPFAVLAVGLVVADLFRAGIGQNPAQPTSKATQPMTPAIRYLQRHRPARFAGPSATLGLPPIPPDVALRYRLYDVRGYDYPVAKRYDRLWRRFVAKPNQFATGQFPVEVNSTSLPVLDLLGVRDVIQQRDQLPPFGPGIHRVYDGPDAQIYANDRALPRAFLATGQTVIPNDDAAMERIARPGFDARGTVVSDHPLPELPLAPSSGASSGGTARIARYDPERVVIHVRARQRAELVLSDLEFPGWRSRVDGHPSRIDRVDYLLRGVPVGRGIHRVEFEYRPGSWTGGWILSLLGLLALATATGLGLRGNRLGPWRRPVTEGRPEG